MPKKVWKVSMLLDIVDLARDGLSDRAIAKALNVSYEIFKIWKKKKPSVRKALRRGRGKKEESEKYAESIQEYVYRRMPARIKDLFDKLKAWEKDPNYLARAEAMLKSEGKQVRQHLFVEFLVAKSFNPSEACRMTGISKSTLDNWIRSDPAFAELVEEVSWHKKNFLDGAYWNLVRKGSEAAILHGQRSLNADRGFAQVTKISHEGKIDHDHDHSVRIESLPLKLRKKVMAALEAGKPVDDIPVESIPDAEIIEKE